MATFQALLVVLAASFVARCAAIGDTTHAYVRRAARIPCDNGHVISVPVPGGADGEVQDYCECWGEVYSLGLLSNTFYGEACNQLCRSFCSGRGMCSISTRGKCQCDDPMHWEGDRCELRTSVGDPGESCSVGLDCTSGVCLHGVCQAPTCADGVQNGGEAGVDCGAPCGPCDAGTPCTSGATCASGVCTNGVCAAPTCSDGVKNGDESDVDCGGSACSSCAVGQACSADGDCATCECSQGTCAPHSPACGDVSTCVLRKAMGTACPLCSTYTPFVNAALREFDMTCPVRSSAFLAHVAVSTGGLAGDLESAAAVESATGSAIGLQPAALRRACAVMPAFYTAFAAEFPACVAAASSQEDACGTCGTAAAVAAVASRPALAFRIAGWWFHSGAQAELGSPCGDLRVASDDGLGNPATGGGPTRGDAGTGFHLTVPCTVGFDGVTATTVTSYVTAYTRVQRLWDPAFPTCTSANSPSGCGAIDARTSWFSSGISSTCTNRVCSTCATCGAAGSEYQIGGCVGAFDRQCAQCSTCQEGLAVVTPCSATKDTVCSPCSECAAGHYESSPCSTASDRVCSACTSCSSTEWATAPCSTQADTECAPCPVPASSFPACDASSSLNVTSEDMVQLAGCAAQNAQCKGHAARLLEALEEYDMACPLRAAALIANIRYATGFVNFKQFRAPSTAPGAALVWLGGAIPLLPENARAYCRDVPAARALFQLEVGTNCAAADAGDPCACGIDEAVATLIARPEHAFRSAAWWYARGARQAIGSPCNDLRGDADFGIGAFGLPSPAATSPGVGFRKITSCILGFGPVLPAPQAVREEMYIQAMRFWEPSYLHCAIPGHPWPTCSDGSLNGLESCVDGGGGCASKCAIGATCFDDSDCQQGGSTGTVVCRVASSSPGAPRVCSEVTVAERCADGTRNGDELGVDCGGSCGANCGVGEQCTGPQDCASGACSAGRCVPCVHGAQDESGVCTCWGANRTTGVLSTVYYGADCSQSCRADRCRGRGMCSASVVDKCVCDEPLLWEGDHCEQSTCGHGYAVYQTPTTVTCTCSSGWTGPSCDVPVACVHGDWDGGTCECLPGWSGVHCSVAVGVVRRCSGHGVWDTTNYACICDSGWVGGQCETFWKEVYAQPMCFVGAWANGTGSACNCDPFWSGTTCNETQCEYGWPGVGISAQLECKCIDSTWTGANCGVSTRGDCFFRGTFNAATSSCACDHGWSGSECRVMEWDANGSEASAAGFKLVAASVNNADSQAAVRVVHAPELCNKATYAQGAPPGSVCLPFEVAVLSSSAVRATFTIDPQVKAELPDGATSTATLASLSMQETTASAAGLLGVETGDAARLGTLPPGCTAAVEGVDAAAGTVTARLCPGRFYYVVVGSWQGFTQIGDGSGNHDIAGQELTPDINAARSVGPSWRVLGVVASLVALAAANTLGRVCM